ncbi:HXXEE domain-containing protein [Nonomuraea polychroma]|uniref:HXXEE domain-containing protein n=1 Tax=Nonomuraea polychroma TaxID=46176 RepID=UPI003D8AA076
MGRVPATVTWGLLAAWAVHDAEEVATMAGWARKARPRLERRFPNVPWERLEVSQRHVNVAIGLMGGVMAGAAALAALPLVLGGVHVLAHVLTRPRRANVKQKGGRRP